MLEKNLDARGPLDSCLLDNPTLKHMKIPTETTISSKAIYFPRLKNRHERQPRRMHPEKGRKRREGHACGPPLLFSILSNSSAVDLQASTARTRSCGRSLRLGQFAMK
ncbi:hypothetical protein AVEN_238252-1 [Araneus ventricosus]|uniref:Uncharacterized protein n=1 Tax=Araneus ventricosus TaxID=182803 RepID=A0A4Y2QMP6_ARAVE|nr:hypothetical protein AVEN_257742-1 [Araneus ventricosus]GBN64651.1 hypothetical protein AVEN_238252-1 [Araneus ventricosus]